MPTAVLTKIIIKIVSYFTPYNANALCNGRCLERFFKYVNQKAGKLVVKRRGGFAVESLELSGVDYLWRVSIYVPCQYVFLTMYIQANADKTR